MDSVAGSICSSSSWISDSEVQEDLDVDYEMSDFDDDFDQGLEVPCDETGDEQWSSHEYGLRSHAVLIPYTGSDDGAWDNGGNDSLVNGHDEQLVNSDVSDLLGSNGMGSPGLIANLGDNSTMTVDEDGSMPANTSSSSQTDPDNIGRADEYPHT